MLHNKLENLLSPINIYSKRWVHGSLEPLVEGSGSLLTPGCVVDLD